MEGKILPFFVSSPSYILSLIPRRFTNLFLPALSGFCINFFIFAPLMLIL